MDNTDVLIRLSDGSAPQWSELTSMEEGNDYGFSTSAFDSIGTVDVKSLKSKNGIASIKELERRLAPSKSLKVTPEGAPQFNR